MMVARGRIAVLEFHNQSVHTDIFPSRLDAVLSYLDSGALGDGAHGSQAHVDALARVEDEARRIRASIVDAREVGK